MEHFDIKEASEVPITFLDTANKFLNESEPWKMTDEKKRAEVLLAALEYMYHITVLLSPLLPLATEKVFAGLGMSEIKWDPNFRYTQTDFTLTKPEILFERVEYTPPKKQEKTLNVTIHPDLEQQVIYTRIQIPNNSKKQSKPLQAYIANRLQEIDTKELRKNPILTAYYEHLDTLGLTGQEPAGANLLNLVEKNNKLPNINRLVDIYNVTSLATGLSF